MDEASAALRRLLRARPGEPRAQLYLGIVEGLGSKGGADRLLRDAAAGFAREGEGRGEIAARTSLAWNLIEQGRLGEARAEVLRADGVAAALRRRELTAQVDLWRGYLAFHEDDYARASRWYDRVERALFPDGPPWLQQRFLHWRGRLQISMGRHREALETFRREAELLRKGHNEHLEAFARYYVAHVAGYLVQRGELAPAEWDAYCRESLDTALHSKNRVAEVNTRLFLLAGPAKDASEAVRQLRAAEKAVATMEDYPRRSLQRFLGKALWHAEPRRREEALRILDRALAESRDRREPSVTATVLVDRGYLHRLAGRRAEAIRDGLEAVGLLDRVRTLQPDPMVGARVSARWAHIYPLVAGWVLEGASSEKDLDLAFRILEQQRARSLLDAFERDLRRAPGSAARRRTELLGRIAYLQRRLLGSLPAQERERLLSELGRVEAADDALRDEIARQAKGRGLPAAPTSLAEVRQALSPDQAVLLFQIVPAIPYDARLAEGAGSFVLSVTREGARAHRIAAGADIECRVELLPRAVARRDGSEIPGAVRLYGELLREAIGALPRGIRSLVLVPDGALHRVPFEVLRSSPESAPLGSQYALSVAPSAALWLRWKAGSRSVPAAVLAFADPALTTGAPGAEREAPPWLTGLRLGRLPHGAREARLAVSALGGGGQVLSGVEATEHKLKGAALADYGVLHLAAHAVADEVHPERSAVVLAAGAREEDGLLQAREISLLDLRDRLVVLSACRSSSGALLRGEGLLSLARSFLEAGARAVVGNLWPVRDDEALALVGSFYRRLGEGQSVSGALAGARRERMRAGAPAAAWAGLVVVGDGDLSFRGRQGAGVLPWIVSGGVGMLLLLALVWWLRRRGSG
jgi:tetratricopeptide (TPR) repeat protein